MSFLAEIEDFIFDVENGFGIGIALSFPKRSVNVFRG